MSPSFYRSHGKRIFDLLLVVAALPFLLPILALIALLVWLTSGSPVLFRQQRPGRHARPYTLYKFRTMRDIRDERGELLPDNQRLTRLGRFLRKASLDELPELLNVLKGEMSLVGPRPLLERYLPYYTGRERLRFEVLPGITGWAQVNGRNDLPWNERFALDVWYVENLSLALDLKILWMTFFNVLRGEHVKVAPHLTLRDLDEERRRERGVAAVSGSIHHE